MKRWRGLCIGAGYFSGFHFDAWQRIDDVEIVGVCDLDKSKAQRACAGFPGAKSYTDAARALESLQPDFVDIITRPDTHLPLVDLAAADGRAIICQKPLADDFATAGHIVRLAAERNARMMVHENFRFQPWYREIKRLWNAGTIGRRLHSLTFHARPGDGWGAEAYVARQPYFRIMPRLLVHETGVHFIDVFRFLGGEISETYAILRKLNDVIAGEDTGLLTFRFNSGAVAVWDANRYNESTAEDARYTFGTLSVEADGGHIRLDHDGRLFVKPLGQPEYEHAYEHQRRGFAGDCVWFTQKHFIDCLNSGEPFETSGEQYLRTLAVQEAVYRSAAWNRPIAPAPDHDGSADPAMPGNRRIVDLSLPIDNQLRGAEITIAKTIAKDGWNATTLSLYSHCGTHMDAPKHFCLDRGITTIDRIDLSVCCGPARVIDLTPVGPRELLTVERLGDSAAAVCKGDRLLIRTGWSRRFGTDAYRNQLPRISKQLAHWMVERQVAMIGVESPSVADVNDLEELTEVHQILFRGGVVIVEGLTNLDQLQNNVVEFIALPLRVVAGDGCPVRAVAIEYVQTATARM